MIDYKAVATAYTHPLRMQILDSMDDGIHRSPVDLAAQLGEPLGNVAYHVRQLLDDGFLRLTRTRQVRGAAQHFYRLTAKAKA